MRIFLVLRFFALAVAVVGGPGQAASADDSRMKGFEQELAHVIRWEILWNDSPTGFRVPDTGSAKIALYATPDSLSYCSRDLGVCVRYGVLPNRNWESLGSIVCNDTRGDSDQLLEFVGKKTTKPIGGQDSRPTTVGGPIGLTGTPRPEETLWLATLKLGSREEIVEEYRHMRPKQIQGLQEWLRTQIEQDHGRKSATIACFAPSDPLVYIYVEPLPQAPYTLAVFWDRERKDWVLAFVFQGVEFQGTIEELRRVVEAIPCSRLHF